MSRVLFVTGITGAIGVEVLRHILKRSDVMSAYFLVRGACDHAAASRWAALLATATRGALRPEDVRYLRPVCGDLVFPHLGLGSAALEAIQHETTHILHAAALIDLFAPRDVVRPVNVDGTMRVLELANGCSRLQAFGYVSTLYVAGKRTGRIFEHELEHDAGHVSAYERSKYEAELAVRARARYLPVSVYRLPLLLGRREDGYVHTFLTAHRFMELFLTGRCSVLPGAPGRPLDFMPTDLVASTLVHLFLDGFRPGTTYQLSAGDRAASVSEVLRAVAAAARTQGLPPPHFPPYVDGPELDAVCAGNAVAADVSSGALWTMRAFGEYLCRPKIFDCRSVEEDVGNVFTPPALKAYLPAVVRYCVESDWGRHRDRASLALHADRVKA